MRMVSASGRNARCALLLLLFALVLLGCAACDSAAGTGRHEQAPSSTSTTIVSGEPGSTTTATADAAGLGEDAPFGLVYPDLPGDFPSTLDVGGQVIHMKAVGREITTPQSVTDFWRQPATGRFRKAVSRLGDERLPEYGSLAVFTGERLQGYSFEPGSSAGKGYDFSYAAYAASAMEDKVDPFAEEQGEIGERVTELRQAVESRLLLETGREQAGGREIIHYHGTFSEDYPFRRVVLADAATGFPLDDRIYRLDGALYICRLADLEVLDHPDLNALFSLTFPAGITPATDEQLPQMPERASGLEDCLRELQKLSGEVAFPLYWLGESAGGLPLDMVEPGAAGGRRPWDTVVMHYRDPAHPVAAYVGLGVFELSARPELKKPLEGWKLVRTVTVAGNQDKIYSASDGTSLFYVALRDGVEIDLYGWSDTAPMTQAELIEAAKGLRVY